MTMTAGNLADEEEAPARPAPMQPPRPTSVANAPVSPATAAPNIDSALLHGLQTQLREITSQMSTLQNVLDSMQQRLDRLERDLGV